MTESKKLDFGESKNKSSAWPAQPLWFEKGSDLINIYYGLSKLGMKEKDIFKILGSNWLEFFKISFG